MGAFAARRSRLRSAVAVLIGWLGFVGAECRAGDVLIREYAVPNPGGRDLTHLGFGNGFEFATAGNRLWFRESRDAPFQKSTLEGLNDAHSVAWDARDRLFYVADSGNHRLLAISGLSRPEVVGTAQRLAGVPLDRPHDIVCDADTGWLYALNPNKVAVFRFRGFGKEESALDLSQHLGYSRALTLAGKTLYVIGSSAGKIVEIEDFGTQKYHVHTSVGKRRDAPAGSWKTTGLVPNDADFHDGYWYVTSYFCPTYAAGTDCDENKLIRFKSWRDFEAGTWEDLSALLPKEMVPYYLTPAGDALYLAGFYHEPDKGPGRVFRITTPGK